jgi:hypothetical protein
MSILLEPGSLGWAFELALQYQPQQKAKKRRHHDMVAVANEPMNQSR